MAHTVVRIKKNVFTTERGRERVCGRSKDYTPVRIDADTHTHTGLWVVRGKS